MIKLRFADECEPQYMTEHSIGCDLVARNATIIEPGQVCKVDTGVWIEQVQWNKAPEGMIPDIQLRARSGLAYKHGITLANGVGTIDADYPDEIAALLLNTSRETFHITKGMRIAQLVLAWAGRFEGIAIGGERKGGFGSTKT